MTESNQYAAAFEAPFAATDPGYIRRFCSFAFDEVPNEPDMSLAEHTRFTAILAVLLGCQGVDAFRALLPAALDAGVTPVEAKEIVYQATAYLGMGRVFPFLRAANDVLAERGVALPLAEQSTTIPETRLQAGNQAQIDIFGEGMRESWLTAPAETAHITRWLADNCFGDYYTRTGLDLKTRELITFCFLYAQGGAEPQLLAHARANLSMGNDKAFLIKILSACVPFIGYPRTLNALRVLNEAAGA